MRKEFFAGRRRTPKTSYWNIMFQRGNQLVLKQVACIGPPNFDELRKTLDLPFKADILFERI